MEPIRTSVSIRMFVVFGIMLLFPLAIVIQIMRVQFIEGENLQALWRAQALDEVPVPAKRGRIYDTHGRLLVTNSVSYTAAIDPRAPGARSEQIALVPDALAHFTSRSAVHYRRTMSQAPANSRYIVLERGLSRQAYDSLKSMRVRGLILEENFRRRYNFDELAAHVVGHVNHELTGVMGIENSYERFLRGTDGSRQVRRDSRNRVREYVGAPKRLPVQGNNVVTTIDAHIQAIAEDELRAGVQRTRATKGTVIIVNPQTGAIVALANYPTFNPNQPAVAETINRRNSAIADMVEPGSTFKLITAIAAVEQNVVTFDEIFETPSNGRRLIHGQWMRDHDPLGNMNFAQVMQRSSNIATAEIAMRIQPETFYQYVRNAGFGSATGIDIPAEEAGRLRRPFEWSAVSLPWLSIGYEVQVTPLQMVMAYAAFANGGNLMRPYLVDRVEDERGRIIHQNQPKTVRRAFNPAAIRSLKPVFAGVISDSGTARFVSVDGLEIAGKTGTAQKFIDGRYQTRYRASFVGFYPTEHPKYVAIVMLDEPRTSIYGGTTAGPIFRNIARRIIGVDSEILSNTFVLANQPNRVVPTVTGLDVDQATSYLQFIGQRFRIQGRGDVVIEQSPVAGSEISRTQEITLLTGTSQTEETDGQRVPDVVGLSMRDAIAVLKASGYVVSKNGSGTVATQFPQAGAVMAQGRTVSLRGRTRSMEQLVAATGGVR